MISQMRREKKKGNKESLIGAHVDHHDDNKRRSSSSSFFYWLFLVPSFYAKSDHLCIFFRCFHVVIVQIGFFVLLLGH